MAKLIPSLSSCLARMESGEKRFARRLEDLLEDDYLCWYNVRIGANARHPDFIVLHPQRGLLVLEVKDWRLDTIAAINPQSASLRTPQGLKQALNPLVQARHYALSLKETLERDAALIAPAGHAYAGHLLCPYGFGVVLSNITRKEFAATDLGEVLTPDLVICKDEMTESVTAEEFQARLWQMLKVSFRHTLTLPQIDRIRWHLFPEIRIHQGSLLPLENQDDSVESGQDSLLRVMDLQQEQLARSLGEGHRVIHGVAGSGKTLILGYRCAFLSNLVAKPILVLCFNVALASKLHHAMDAKGLGHRVTVRHFHGWCYDQLRAYHADMPAPSPEFYDALVAAVIRAVDRGAIPRAQYSAIMIDEGHDFAPQWLKLICQMVDPETNSLLLLYDDAQAIYGAKRTRDFSFSSIGIQARGRTTILRINYRNTNEILNFAYSFAKDVLPPEDAEEDGVPLVQPESGGRHGRAPKLAILDSLKAETSHIAKAFRGLQEQGRRWNEMAVVYHAKFIGEEIVHTLRDFGVPVEWLHESKEARRFKPDQNSVKVMTIHSSKGLEFPIVAVPGVGFLPYEDARADARLLYVAMTRAMDELIVTAHRKSEFVLRLAGR